MNSLKYILLRLLILAFILAGIHVAYVKFWFENDLQKHSPILNLVRDAEMNSDILYFGESSNWSYRADDPDLRSISNMTASFFPGLRMGTVEKGAIHAGNYRNLIRHISADSPVKTIVVTLNLRSFNAQWIYSDLETALQKSMVLLDEGPALWNRFRLSFKNYEIKSVAERERQVKAEWKKSTLVTPFPLAFKNVIEWDRYCAETGVKREDGSFDQEKTWLTCHYIKAYAFQIDTLNNPRIKDFDAIVEICRKRGYNLVFNLMAENTEEANDLLGPDIVWFMRTNRDLLVERYTRMGVLVADNLEKVPDPEFMDRTWTTEHYAWEGRWAVAEGLAETMKHLHPEQYIPQNKPFYYKTKFFHDCEMPAKWGNMESIRPGNFVSRWRSSIAFIDQPQGLLLETTLDSLPLNLKKELKYSAWFYRDADTGAKLVLEIHDGKRVFREETALDELFPVGTWTRAEYRFTLPEGYAEKGILKIWFENHSEARVYADDLLVEVGG